MKIKEASQLQATNLRRGIFQKYSSKNTSKTCMKDNNSQRFFKVSTQKASSVNPQLRLGSQISTESTSLSPKTF